jgi:hypothetical protein
MGGHTTIYLGPPNEVQRFTSQSTLPNEIKCYLGPGSQWLHSDVDGKELYHLFLLGQGPLCLKYERSTLWGVKPQAPGNLPGRDLPRGCF